MIAAFLPLIGTLVDKLFPDPQAAAAAKVQVMEMAQRGELAQLDAELKLATGQLEVNKAEAASTSLFVSGWRPFIGWTCGAAFAYKFVLAPAGAFAMAAAGHAINLPVLDFTEMSTILLGMLGLGGLRTIEKVKGVS
ncbi:MAG: 3TM-type holin [Pseudomonadota bacterium]